MGKTHDVDNDDDGDDDVADGDVVMLTTMMTNVVKMAPQVLVSPFSFLLSKLKMMMTTTMMLKMMILPKVMLTRMMTIDVKVVPHLLALSGEVEGRGEAVVQMQVGLDIYQ